MSAGAGRLPGHEGYTMKFNIWSKVSGAFLGEYEGETPDAAIDAMHKDAGYAEGVAELARDCKCDPAELTAQFDVVEVA